MIQCIPHRKIYYNDENGYTIAAYKTYQTIPESAVNQSFKSGESVFTAIGTAIPFIEGIDTGLEGIENELDKSSRNGIMKVIENRK